MDRRFAFPWLRSHISFALLLFAVAGCSGGGGSEDVVLVLQSDAPCYGVQIDAAGDAADLVCNATQEVVDKSCRSFNASDSQGVDLSVSGCVVPAGTALFQCTGSRSVVTSIRDGAELRCGCGCAKDCPSATSARVCNAGDLACIDTAAAVASVRIEKPAAEAAPQRSTTSQVVATTSSTLGCGTCCDVLDDKRIFVTSSNALQQLSFVVSIPDDPEPRCPVFGGCDISAGFDGPSSEEEIDDHTLRICVSTSHPRSALDTLVAQCPTQTGGDNELSFSAVQAVDGDLRPMSPAPSLVGQ